MIEDNNFEIILTKFQQYDQDIELPQKSQRIKQTMDTIVAATLSVPQMHYSLHQQLIQNTTQLDQQKYLVRNYIDTILRAITILQHRLFMVEEQLVKTDRTNQNQQSSERREIVDDNWLLYEQYRMLTQPFGIVGRVPCKQIRSSVKNRGLQVGYLQQLFGQQKVYVQQSPQLTKALAITLICLLIQLFLVLNKLHYLNLLVLLLLTDMLLMGHFDKYSVKTAIVLLIVSAFADLIWFLVMAGPFWNSPTPTSRLTQSFVLIATYILSIFLVLVRMYILFLLLPFRQIDKYTTVLVKLFGNSFELEGRPTSPLALLWVEWQRSEAQANREYNNEKQLRQR